MMLEVGDGHQYLELDYRLNDKPPGYTKRRKICFLLVEADEMMVLGVGRERRELKFPKQMHLSGSTTTDMGHTRT
jgi:hypothetical protein